jgi:hypothetical protein
MVQVNVSVTRSSEILTNEGQMQTTPTDGLYSDEKLRTSFVTPETAKQCWRSPEGEAVREEFIKEGTFLGYLASLHERRVTTQEARTHGLFSLAPTINIQKGGLTPGNRSADFEVRQTVLGHQMPVMAV